MKLIIVLLMVGSNAWAAAAGGVPIHDLKIVSEKGDPTSTRMSSWREGGGWGRGWGRGGGGWGRRGEGGGYDRRILLHFVTKKNGHHGQFPSPHMGAK